MTIVSHPPEVLYAETMNRVARCQTLARRQAAAGDIIGAVSATWAADISTVHAVMWERVIMASPTPDRHFVDITAAVAGALTAFAQQPPQVVTAADVVVAARGGLAAAFDDSARALISRRWSSLDHLEGLPAPTAAEVEEPARQHLDGSAPARVGAERDQEAQQCMASALALLHDGRAEEALALAWQADWSTLEAHLVDAAVAVGDTALVSVDLRWALAVAATDSINALPADFTRAVTTVRARLIESLGSIEGDRLRRRFQPLPA